MQYDNKVMYELKNKIRLVLKDFSPDEDENDLIFISTSSIVPINRELIPVPELIPIVFSGILGFPNLGPGEKIRWQICFKYKNLLCNIAHEKFGIRLYYQQLEGNKSKINTDEIIGKINKGLRIIEKSILQDFSKYQFSQCNITIPNIYYSLNERYQYFRKMAEQAFNIVTEQEHSNDVFRDMVNRINSARLSTSNGFYNTVAMIDAFFSKTEHLFILALPFIDFNCQEDNLLKLIGSRWQDKYKRIFQIETDSNSKRFYDQLVNLKEKFRNTFAHGGFEKAGASLFIHLPNGGTIPIVLTKIKNSPHFNFVPIEKNKFNDICVLLDEFENWLKLGKLTQAIKYIESGLDVPFNEESIIQFRKAIISDEANKFDSLIEHWLFLRGQYRNIGY